MEALPIQTETETEPEAPTPGTRSESKRLRIVASPAEAETLYAKAEAAGQPFSGWARARLLEPEVEPGAGPPPSTLIAIRHVAQLAETVENLVGDPCGAVRQSRLTVLRWVDAELEALLGHPLDDRETDDGDA